MRISAEISEALLAKSTLNEEFHRRTYERIIRAEAKKTKKRFDILILSIISVFFIFASVLIILQIKLLLFQNELIIPSILLILLIIVGGTFVVDYVVVKKHGKHALEQKLGGVNEWENIIINMQMNQTELYNYIKKAFDSIVKVNSEFILSGFILRYYITASKESLKTQPEKLYQYLFLIATKRNSLLEKKLSKDEELKEVTKEVEEHLENYKFILIELLSKKQLPSFFAESIKLMKRNISFFTKGNYT